MCFFVRPHAVVLASATILAALNTPARADWWQIQPILRGGSPGRHCGAATLPDGHPAISFADDADPALKYAWYDGAAWQVTTVDSPVNLQVDTRLLVLGDGQPAIVYVDDDRHEVRIARFDGAAWNAAVLASSHHDVAAGVQPSGMPAACWKNNANHMIYACFDGTCWHEEDLGLYSNTASGTRSSLAFLPNGEPAISFADAIYSGDKVKYTWRASGTWRVTVVDDGLPTTTSLLVQPDGEPAITYAVGSAVRWARFDGTNWNIETLSASAGSPRAVRLSSGAQAVVYTERHSSQDRDLVCATSDGGPWQTSVIDRLDAATEDYAPLVTSAGGVAVAYYWPPSHALRFAVGTAGQWQIADVVAGETGGYCVSSATLPDGRIAIAYERANSTWDDELWLALQAGDTWTQEPTGMIGTAFGTSLTLLPLGVPVPHHHVRRSPPANLTLLPGSVPAVSYQDSESNHLAYTSSSGGAWQSTTVDPDVASISSSLAVLPDGNPAISYHDNTNHLLKYAWFDGLAWQNEVVATTGNTGNASSLAILPSGYPAIAYVSATEQRVKYASYDGDVWHIETIGACGAAGGSPSLAILSSGRPAISYAYSASITGTVYLHYAWRDGKKWNYTNQIVTGAGYGSKLRIQPDGYPSIVSRAGNESVYYTWYDGAAWHNEIVCSATFAGLTNAHWTAMEFSASGQPVIVYFRRGLWGLYFAERRVAGDTNCDGAINFYDINPFILALLDPPGYQAAQPTCNLQLADVNGNGAVDFLDINPFVALLLSAVN